MERVTSIIYVGGIGVTVLAMLGILAVIEVIAQEMRGRRAGR